MQNGSGKAKKFAAISLLVFGYGAANSIRAESGACNSYYSGRCYQWCSDGGVGMWSCNVNNNDDAMCYCSDGEYRKL